MNTEPQFIPQVSDPESTDYFDPRGAMHQLFQDEDAIAITGRPSPAESPRDEGPASSRHSPVQDRTASPSNDEFGTFNFKNLPVLKQANDELIRMMQASPSSASDGSATTSPMAIVTNLAEPTTHLDRRRSISQRGPKVAHGQAPPPPPPPPPPPVHGTGFPMSPPSPTNSSSSIGSGLSRAPSTPASGGHNRRPSEYGPLERFKHNHLDSDGHRRNSMPSRLRTSSMSSADFAGIDPWAGSEKSEKSDKEKPSALDLEAPSPPPPAPATSERKPHRDSSTSDRIVTCLLAEDNPISIKILEVRLALHKPTTDMLIITSS